MKRIVVILITGVCLVWMTACTRNIVTDTADSKAVVESYLMAGRPVEAIIREESVTGTVDTLQPLETLSVTVMHQGAIYPLAYTGADGVYRNESLTAIAGEAYEIRFTYNSKEVFATTTVPAKPMNFTGSASTITAPTPPTSGTVPTMPDPVNFSWSNPNNDYHLMIVRCIEPNPVEISTGGAVRLGSGTFRTEPTQTSYQPLRPMQFKYYGLHEVILYRILPEYAALYEDNGSNSNNLTDPPGNIFNGLGIFTGVNTADTLHITVQ